MNKNGAMDKGILVTVLFLMAFGIIFVYSSSFPVATTRFDGEFFFVNRQIVRVVLGLAALLIFSAVDYRKLANISPTLFWISVALLGIVLILPDSFARNGAKRWLPLGPFTFQVSELARIALIITISNQLSKVDEEGMKKWSNLRTPVICSIIVVILIMKEPNYSTGMLIAVLVVAMFFVSGLQKRWIALLATLGVGGALAFGLSAGYRMKRVMAFLKPEENASGSAFQSNQALMGIGHGGVMGQGLGAGEQKHFFLPESYTDFIYSILGEEIGFIGLTVLGAAYLIIILRGFMIARNAQDRFGSLLAFGITIIFASYFLMHTFVNARLFPTTGVPLPFISYGGMSLVFTAASIGILLNISRNQRSSKEFR